MSGLQNVGAWATFQAGMLAPALVILAAWSAGRDHLLAGCAAAALSWLVVLAASGGDDINLLLLALLGSLAATAAFLVLAYRRKGSFVRHVAGAALLRPWAFREVADARALHQAALIVVLPLAPVLLLEIPLERRLAFIAVFVARWMLVAAVAFAVARLVPPCDVEWRRVLCSVFFAAAPVAEFAFVVSRFDGPAGLDARSYPMRLWYPGYAGKAWLALVLYVALHAALRRDRVQTAAIALLLVMAAWMSAGLQTRLWHLII